MTDPDARSAADAFALPPGERSVERFAGAGHINGSWLVTARDDAERVSRFLLQRINERVFRRPDLVMENVARVTAHAGRALAGVADADRRALRLVSTRVGRPWHADDAGGVWRVFHFVEGTVTRETASSASDAYAAARAFGAFLRLLGTYDGPRLHETVPGFHDTPARLAALERTAAVDRAGRLAGSRAELQSLLARRPLAHALAEARARGDVREMIVHNDAKLANVLLDARTGEGLCVVDLDTVMPGLALYDFGDLARSTVSEAAEDETDLRRVVVRRDVFDALAAGFLDGTGDQLGGAERALLATAARVITYEQAVRFLTDWLDGDRYYRVDPARERHNLERARAQIALLEAFERD